MTWEQWLELDYHDRAWRLAQIMSFMNNEDAYYSGWLYIWPDGETYEACRDDFDNEESYMELENAFIDYYADKEFHNDGLFFSKKVYNSIVDDAHMWDEHLGLKPINVLTPNW